MTSNWRDAMKQLEPSLACGVCGAANTVTDRPITIVNSSGQTRCGHCAHEGPVQDFQPEGGLA